jgi:hypothetical protein
LPVFRPAPAGRARLVASPRPGGAHGGRARRLAHGALLSRCRAADDAAQVSQADGDSAADLADALVAEPAERQGMVEALPASSGDESKT